METTVDVFVEVAFMIFYGVTSFWRGVGRG